MEAVGRGVKARDGGTPGAGKQGENFLVIMLAFNVSRMAAGGSSVRVCSCGPQTGLWTQQWLVSRCSSCCCSLHGRGLYVGGRGL